MERTPQQHNLVLILARAFAAQLATAVFLLDPEGTFIYYNEAAERLTGRPFIEGAGSTADEWLYADPAAGRGGRRGRGPGSLPLGTTMLKQEPAYGIVTFRTADGVDRRVETATFPLFAHTEDFVGSFSRSGVAHRRGPPVKGRIWGSRGSIASPGEDTKRYGGNTSCIELRPPGCDVVILDAGTGIRELGVRLVREGAQRMFLLLTHLHVDHLEGLGMFEPIWRKETELHIWGPSSPVASLEQRIATYFSPPLFPVHLSEVPATIEYHDASESEWQIDGARFSSNAIIHPGSDGGLPHRVEGPGPRVPHRSRTRPGRRPRDRSSRLDLGVRPRPPRGPADPRLPVHAAGVREPARVRPFDHRTRRTVRREGGGRPAGAVPSRPDAPGRPARRDARGRRRSLGRGRRSMHRPRRRAQRSSSEA